MSQGSPEGDGLDVDAMARLADGDDLALNEIMDRWASRLGAYLVRFLGNATEATDLVQETFVAVYRARAQYRPTARFSSWIFGIASNLARQKLRWRRRHPEVALNLDFEESSFTHCQNQLPADPSTELQAGETASAIRSAVLALPPELRKPLVLGIYEEMSQAEIAHILKCSTKAVETRIYRAKQILRKALHKQLAH